MAMIDKLQRILNLPKSGFKTLKEIFREIKMSSLEKFGKFDKDISSMIDVFCAQVYFAVLLLHDDLTVLELSYLLSSTNRQIHLFFRKTAC